MGEPWKHRQPISAPLVVLGGGGPWLSRQLHGNLIILLAGGGEHGDERPPTLSKWRTATRQGARFPWVISVQATLHSALADFPARCKYPARCAREMFATGMVNQP